MAQGLAAFEAAFTIYCKERNIVLPPCTTSCSPPAHPPIAEGKRPYRRWVNPHHPSTAFTRHPDLPPQACYASTTPPKCTGNTTASKSLPPTSSTPPKSLTTHSAPISPPLISSPPPHPPRSPDYTHLYHPSPTPPPLPSHPEIVSPPLQPLLTLPAVNLPPHTIPSTLTNEDPPTATTRRLPNLPPHLCAMPLPPLQLCSTHHPPHPCQSPAPNLPHTPAPPIISPCVHIPHSHCQHHHPPLPAPSLTATPYPSSTLIPTHPTTSPLATLFLHRNLTNTHTFLTPLSVDVVLNSGSAKVSFTISLPPNSRGRAFYGDFVSLAGVPSTPLSPPSATTKMSLVVVLVVPRHYPSIVGEPPPTLDNPLPCSLPMINRQPPSTNPMLAGSDKPRPTHNPNSITPFHNQVTLYPPTTLIVLLLILIPVLLPLPPDPSLWHTPTHPYPLALPSLQAWSANNVFAGLLRQPYPSPPRRRPPPHPPPRLMLIICYMGSSNHWFAIQRPPRWRPNAITGTPNQLASQSPLPLRHQNLRRDLGNFSQATQFWRWSLSPILVPAGHPSHQYYLKLLQRLLEHSRTASESSVDVISNKPTPLARPIPGLLA